MIFFVHFFDSSSGDLWYYIPESYSRYDGIARRSYVYDPVDIGNIYRIKNFSVAEDDEDIESKLKPFRKNNVKVFCKKYTMDII